MTDIFPVPTQTQQQTWVTSEQYEQLYQQSINDPDEFWAQQAEQFLDWQTPWTQVSKADMAGGKVEWFCGASLNVSVNCIDRHLATRASQTAIIWEGDNPKESQHISYQDLHDSVCQLANGLLARGIKRGDRVCIYMPMIP